MGKWLLLIATPLLLVTAVVSGQDQRPFRATTDFVTTDVIVRKDGKFVPDLRLDEFRVYEDDVLQTISLFDPRIGGRSLGNLATASAGRRPAAREGLILPSARAASDSSGRLFLIFIDDLHFESSATPKVREVLRRIRDTLIHDNDLVGFVSSGYSSIAFDPSYDYEHRRFNEAIDRIRGSALTPADIIDRAEFETNEGPTGLRYNAHVAFQAAQDLIDQVSAVTDRRKVFIYVSNGYNFNPLAESRYERLKERYADQHSFTDEDDEKAFDAITTHRSNGFQTRNEWSFADLTSELAMMVRAAVRANVTFYAVDPRGLIASYNEVDMRTSVSYADWRDYFTTQADSLKVLSDETGGFCVCDTNDFDGALRRIDAETSDFYRIGYTSSNPDPLKVRRFIRIEVTRAGLEEPIYRKEYTLVRPDGLR